MVCPAGADAVFILVRIQKKMERGRRNKLDKTVLGLVGDVKGVNEDAEIKQIANTAWRMRLEREIGGEKSQATSERHRSKG